MIYFLSILISIMALIFATYQIRRNILPFSKGNVKMRKISNLIKDGAMTFIKREYTYIILFVLASSIIISLFIGWKTAVCFVLGAIFSMIAGFIGMRTSTQTNVRCTNEAKENGLINALKIAFAGGSVMGMTVTGLGFLGVLITYLIFKDPQIVIGYSFGSSSVALFSRVGGGIYTKAADVGADLVGKVEKNIPEDDPRNPAVIADNVGDNVGDVAGMGADLFESFVGAIISALVLGKAEFSDAGIKFPLAIIACGIISSIIIAFLFMKRNHKNVQNSLMNTIYITSSVIFIFSFLFSYFYFKNMNGAIVVITGILCGIFIGLTSEYFTSEKYRFVKMIAEESETGAGTNIIAGISTGMFSTVIPIIFISISILISYKLMEIYGISLSAVGMLASTSITVSVDAYGPIADNAGGISEMSDLDEDVRKITDSLDSVGNTTAAIGKGFAIGSAALTSLSLFVTYAHSVNLKDISILNSFVVSGMFFGAMLTFLFSALTMNSVGKAAFKMIEEVRRQFNEIPGILLGESEPDYKKCIDISTKASINEMILPGIIAVFTPFLVGFFFGVEALGGMLAGSLITGVIMAIFMANSGGAWDNAKKYIESGENGGKNSPAHKAAIVGDTVGDPFKDTSGPSINILIKLMTVVSIVCAELFLK